MFNDTGITAVFVDRRSYVYTICMENIAAPKVVVLNGSLSPVYKKAFEGGREVTLYESLCLSEHSSRNPWKAIGDTEMVDSVLDIRKNVEVFHVTQRNRVRSPHPNGPQQRELRDEKSTVLKCFSDAEDMDRHVTVLLTFSYRGQKFLVQRKTNTAAGNSGLTPNHYLVAILRCKPVNIAAISCSVDGRTFSNVTAMEAEYLDGRILIYSAFSGGPTPRSKERLLCTFDATELLDGWVKRESLDGSLLSPNLAELRILRATIAFCKAEIEEMVSVRIDNRSLIIYRDSTEVRIVSQVSPQLKICSMRVINFARNIYFILSKVPFLSQQSVNNLLSLTATSAILETGKIRAMTSDSLSSVLDVMTDSKVDY